MQPFEGLEEDWPANPWQQQADAHLLHLQRSLGQEAALVPCMMLAPQGRVHELEGQLAALEATCAAQAGDLQETQAELELLRQRRPQRPDAAEQTALQEKNDFLQVLVARFERKVMALEEENAGLTVALCKTAPVASAASQTEESLHELEGQVALLEEQLRSKEHELEEAKDRLEEEKLTRQKREAVVKGRTAEELALEVETLESRVGFLSDLVNRFEDKTMLLEKQVKVMSSSEKELGAELQQSRQQQEDAEAAAVVKQQQLQQEAEGAALALRDAKKEHNKKVQELLRQLQLAEAKARKMLKAKCQEESKELQQLKGAQCQNHAELRELKELNAQLVERLGKERVEHAETKRCLEQASREKETLEQRVDSLCEQLIQLSELNDSLQ